MTKVQRLVVIASAVVALLVVGGALLVQSRQVSQHAPPPILVQRPVTQAELKRSDGKDGRTCLVAVDGTVYEIAGFTLWKNGKHATSKEQAYCGADLSKVIDKAPHGRKKLEVLTKIGPLKS